MTTFFRLRFAQIAVAFLAALPLPTVRAQDPANLGSVNIQGRRAVYKRVLAVRGKSSDENRIIVLATGQPVTAEILKMLKDTDAEESLDGGMDLPYLKATFLEDGTLKCLIGKGGGSSFTERGKSLEGKAVVAGGRIRGTAKVMTSGTFGKEVTLNFDAPIDAEFKAPDLTKLDPPVKPVVNGKFLGEGKPSQLKFVSVAEHEPFDDKEAFTLIFTEKDHSAAKKPSFDAAFGKFGSALMLSVNRGGGIFGCEVLHTALKKSTFSSVGKIHMVEFEIAGGNVSGHVSTGGALDMFGETWEVELTFAAPLPDKLRNAPAISVKPVAKEPVATEPRGPMKKEPKAAAGPAIAARKLPLPADASNVQFKQLVQQIEFSSARPVDAVATDFSAKLKQQGWKDGAGSLMGKKNAILKREQGDAKLTIMVQPAAAGSVVKIFTEGLDWSGGEAGNPVIKKSGDDDDADAAEKEAEKLIKDALKNLPKGL